MLALETRTSETVMNKTVNAARCSPPPGTLWVADVARIWTEELRKDLARKRRERGYPTAAELEAGKRDILASTVWSYLKESRPMVGSKPGRYADNPVPAPDGQVAAGVYWWSAGREQQLRDWWNSRAGKAHGTGTGRPKGSKRKPRTT
jgi:hypothetical protein